jgi:hypothetical protein
VAEPAQALAERALADVTTTWTFSVGIHPPNNVEAVCGRCPSLRLLRCGCGLRGLLV